MLRQVASQELLSVILALNLKIQELDTPGCKLGKNRTIRALALDLAKTAKVTRVKEILYFISSDRFFAYTKAKEVLATFNDIVSGAIDVEFKDANGMSVTNPFIKEENMSKPENALIGDIDFDAALSGLDLEASSQKVEEMRDGGGEAIVPGKGDNDCTSGACAI